MKGYVTLKVGNHTYHMPKEATCNSADRDYLATATTLAEQHKAGLITDREMLDNLIIAHATWAAI